MTHKIPLLNYELRDPLDEKSVKFDLKMNEDEFYDNEDLLFILDECRPITFDNGTEKLVTDVVAIVDNTMYMKFGIFNGNVEAAKIYWPIFQLFIDYYNNEDPIGNLAFREIVERDLWNLMENAIEGIVPHLCEYERNQQILPGEYFVDIDEWNYELYYKFNIHGFLAPHLKYENSEWKFDLKQN